MFIDISDIKKSYGAGESRVEVLKGISFGVEKGEFCVLLGPSGSGKSTLLNIIGGIDDADSGYISINGEKIENMKEKALTDYKAQQTQKDTHAAKEAKFRELLKSAGVLDKYADRVVRLSGEDIDKLELDDKGEVKDAKKHADSLKADWSDFVGTTTTTGAKVDTPPTNTGSKMTKEQIINIKDANERQAAIAANPEAFGLAAKE